MSFIISSKNYAWVGSKNYQWAYVQKTIGECARKTIRVSACVHNSAPLRIEPLARQHTTLASFHNSLSTRTNVHSYSICSRKILWIQCEENVKMQQSVLEYRSTPSSISILKESISYYVSLESIRTAKKRKWSNINHQPIQ